MQQNSHRFIWFPFCFIQYASGNIDIQHPLSVDPHFQSESELAGKSSVYQNKHIKTYCGDWPTQALNPFIDTFLFSMFCSHDGISPVARTH